MQRERSGRIVVLSYDFAGTAVGARVAAEERRSSAHIADSLVISWSTHPGTFEPSHHVRVVALPAFLGAFRPVYDLLFVFIAPYILIRHHFEPEEIVIADFPLVWAAAMIRFWCGGKIRLRLHGLPRQLGATRGRTHRWYHVMNEFFAGRIPDTYEVINETTRSYLISLGIAAEKILMRTPDTITPDLPLIARAIRGAARSRLGITEGPLTLSVGRLEPEKAFDELIEVFARSGAIGTLVIAGRGVLEASLEEKARRLQARVVFAGAQNRQQLWELFTDADAFVLLSKSEALGLVVWEAMYGNVPVIGRPVGGIRESIGNNEERGFFWDTTDGAAHFKTILMRCFAKDAQVQTMIERAKAYVADQLGMI